MSIEILKKYCENSDNKILINKDNGGVSSARNIGLGLAKGDLIVFWDADDKISKNFLLDLVTAHEKNTLTLCGFTLIDLNEKRIGQFCFSY